jgi:hypothetical protein
MTEPTIGSVATSPKPTSAGPGASTAAVHGASSPSTAPGPISRARAPGTSVAETEPELVWLASDEARQYEGHWVALDPETGTFLGLADSVPHLRMWQARHATIIFVDPPSENWLDG